MRHVGVVGSARFLDERSGAWLGPIGERDTDPGRESGARDGRARRIEPVGDPNSVEHTVDCARAARPSARASADCRSGQRTADRRGDAAANNRADTAATDAAAPDFSTDGYRPTNTATGDESSDASASANPAAALYQRFGFVTVARVGGSLTMVLKLVA